MPDDGDSAGPERLVALLVDLENVAGIDLQLIFQTAASEGRVVVRRAYGNAELIRKFKAELQDLAFDSQALFSTTRDGKNSADIFLTIDAMDLLHQHVVHTFVLATADTDFARLARRLREGGKRVVGVGTEHAGSALVQSCDRFETPSPPKPAARRTHRAGNERDEKIADTVMTAFESAVGEDGSVGGSKLLQAMQRLDPGFDYKRLGFSSFGAFLKSLDLDLEVATDKRGMVVRYEDMGR
ncbi:MAG TPA: NYN domain-containing protein [Candidatus Thermoplasmatota archaeon]|nr:NYN domain-containing protein [Candidatus Thermoplasmatota archaeon]